MSYEEDVDIIKGVFKLCHSKLSDDDLFPILNQIWEVLEKQKEVSK